MFLEVVRHPDALPGQRCDQHPAYLCREPRRPKTAELCQVESDWSGAFVRRQSLRGRFPLIVGFSTGLTNPSCLWATSARCSNRKGLITLETIWSRIFPELIARVLASCISAMTSLRLSVTSSSQESDKMARFLLLLTTALAAVSSAQYTGPCSDKECGESRKPCRIGLTCVPYPSFPPGPRHGCTCSYM